MGWNAIGVIVFAVLFQLCWSELNPVSFMLLGDWGLPGFNQTLIAGQMATWAEQHHANFVVALGDNFYCTSHIILLMFAANQS